MKHLTTTLALLIGSASCAFAQTYGVQAISLPVDIVANTTSNILSTLDVRRQSVVALQCQWNPKVTNETTVTITLDQSVDGASWGTVPLFSWVYLHNAVGAPTTNTVCATTNFTVNGFGYIRLKTIAAASGSGINLEHFKYAVKNPSR